MLSELVIKDFAIIDNLTVTFERGLTILSGETGAGKSIVIDALQLVTGARGESSLVRHGAEKAEVIGCFELDDTSWLKQLDIDVADSEGLILRRVLTKEGRSRAYVNDMPVSVGRLRKIGNRLIEVHAQHEHYALLQTTTQHRLLDVFAQAGPQLTKVKSASDQWHRLQKQLTELRSQSSLSEAEIELLKYQCEELEPWIADAENIESLHEQHQLASASQEISQAVDGCLDQLSEGQSSINDLLSNCIQQLQRPAGIDQSLEEPKQLIESGLIQLQEAVAALQRHRDNQDEQSIDISKLDSTLSRLHELSRKHKVDIEALSEQLTILQNRIDDATQAEGREAELAQQIEMAENEYRRHAQKLHQLRQKAAAKLQRQVQQVMKELGLGKGIFEAAINTDGNASPSPLGFDQIEFKVSMNPGQPTRELSKVASGGELSRIGLALRVVLSEAEPASVMVFDEVDSGVGGAVAQIVGEKLRLLAGGRQVFCVTHLPQVAAQANHHYQISKTQKSQQTKTHIKALSRQQRAEELARMLGGVDITDQTMAHAQEMLERAGGVN